MKHGSTYTYITNSLVSYPKFVSGDGDSLRKGQHQSP